MFLSASKKESIARYAIYYKNKVPRELERVVANDPFSALVKEGLSDIKGLAIPKLTFTLNGSGGPNDRPRILAFEEILKTLVAEKKIELFIRIS